jgi:hypothetical protein
LTTPFHHISRWWDPTFESNIIEVVKDLVFFIIISRSLLVRFPMNESSTHEGYQCCIILFIWNTPLQHECTTLLYISLIRPIITYSSPVWFGTSNTNFNILQRLQNKILRISLNAPRFTQNTQIHRETNPPTIKDLITTLTLNFHSRLPLATGALFYYIRQTLIHPRLKPRLSHDVLDLWLAMLLD